jgi:hypothetical protein
MTVIPTSQESEIRRFVVWSPQGQIVCETLTQKNPSQKWAGRVAQGVDPELKYQYETKKISIHRVSLWHFHVCMYCIPNWLIPSIFSSFFHPSHPVSALPLVLYYLKNINSYKRRLSRMLIIISILTLE